MAMIPASLRAVVLDAPGPPGALHVRELPIPTTRPGEVLIKVEAFRTDRGRCPYRARRSRPVYCDQPATRHQLGPRRQ